MFGGILYTKCTHVDIYDFEIRTLKTLVQLNLLYSHTETQLLFYWYLLILLQMEQTQNGVRK